MVCQPAPGDDQRLLAANIPNYTEGLLIVSRNEQAQALAQLALVSAAELQPAYQAAMEMSVSNLNILFLFTVNIYKNYNGLLILPALAAITQVIMTKFTSQQPRPRRNGRQGQSPAAAVRKHEQVHEVPVPAHVHLVLPDLQRVLRDLLGDLQYRRRYLQLRDLQVFRKQN